MDSKFAPRLDTLPDAQQRLWPELVEVPPEFVLYGGTALALQLGHRASIDFDFFGTAEFDPDRILSAISFLHEASVIQKSPSTLTAIVDRGGPVQVSFFGVPRVGRMKAPHIVEETGLKVASLLDLAGTKAAVVQKRAEAKDYIDLDALIHQGGVELPKALSAACLIYGRQFNPELTLKALCFFGEGNLHSVPMETQHRLAEAVKAVDLGSLPTLDDVADKPTPENGR